METSRSSSTSPSDNFNDGGMLTRRAAVDVDNKKLGRVTWGLWSEAKDDIIKDNVLIKV
jgi:hypothetical protein